MHDQEGRLKQLIGEEVAALLDVNAPPGEAHLNRVRNLVNLRKNWAYVHSPRKWPALLSGSAVVLILVLLQSMRVGTPDIELKIITRELSFVASAPHVILERAAATDFDIAPVELDGSQSVGDNSAKKESVVQLGRSVQLWDSSLPPKLAVRVPGISIPPNSRAFVRWSASQPNPVLSLRIVSSSLKEQKLQVEAERPLALKTSGIVRKGIEGALFFWPMENDLSLRLTAPAETEIVRHVAVSELDFETANTSELASGTSFEPSSAIVQGSVYLTAINSKDLSLRDGESLKLANPSGRLTCELAEKGILVRFRGQASGIVAGSPDHLDDLRPTWLEYIRARQSWMVVPGLAILIITTMYSLATWIRS